MTCFFFLISVTETAPPLPEACPFCPSDIPLPEADPLCPLDISPVVGGIHPAIGEINPKLCSRKNEGVVNFADVCYNEYNQFRRGISQASFSGLVNQKRIVRTCLKRRNFGIFWFVILVRHKALLPLPHQNLLKISSVSGQWNLQRADF